MDEELFKAKCTELLSNYIKNNPGCLCKEHGWDLRPWNKITGLYSDTLSRTEALKLEIPAHDPKKWSLSQRWSNNDGSTTWAFTFEFYDGNDFFGLVYEKNDKIVHFEIEAL